jgi:hypothetical protein
MGKGWAMSVFDLLQQVEIQQLREEVEQLRRHYAGMSDANRMKELAEENIELKLRLALLIRILIAKNVFTAEEFAGLLAEARKPL